MGKSPYFLIATPDRMYFWRQDDLAPNEERTSGQALELILYSWLVDLAESGHFRVKQNSSLGWLSESGLLDG